MLDAVRNRYRVTEEPLRSERRVELMVVLFLLFILLQGCFLAVSYWNPSRVESVAPAADSLVVQAHKGPGGITASQSFVLQARPLFWASRTPLDPLAVVEVVNENKGAAAPPSALDDLTLTGLVAGPEGGAALVQHKGKQMRLGIGDDVAGWQVIKIGADSVEFGSGGKRLNRSLRQLPVYAVESAAEPKEQQENQAGGEGPLQRARDQALNRRQNQKEPERLSLGG